MEKPLSPIASDIGASPKSLHGKIELVAKPVGPFMPPTLPHDIAGDYINKADADDLESTSRQSDCESQRLPRWTQIGYEPEEDDSGSDNNVEYFAIDVQDHEVVLQSEAHPDDTEKFNYDVVKCPEPCSFYEQCRLNIGLDVLIDHLDEEHPRSGGNEWGVSEIIEQCIKPIWDADDKWFYTVRSQTQHKFSPNMEKKGKEDVKVGEVKIGSLDAEKYCDKISPRECYKAMKASMLQYESALRESMAREKPSVPKRQPELDADEERVCKRPMLSRS